MNAGINPHFHHRSDPPQMIDQPEQHCLRYLKSKERELPLAWLDPEEIRRLTQPMKREHWQPPTWEPVATAKAFLERFRTAKSTELKHLGVSYVHFNQLCSEGIARREVLNNGKGEEAYYVLERA